MHNFFKPGLTKAIGLIAVLAIVIGIPLVILGVKSQQNVQQNAAIPANITQNGTHDSCNKVTIQAAENPSCPRLTTFSNNACVKLPGSGTNNITSHQVTVIITSNDGKPHTIAYVMHNEFCTNGNFTSNGSFCQCSDNDQVDKNTVSVPKTLVVNRSSPNGQACGSYQVDFRITAVDNNTSCAYDQNKSGTTSNCETGNTCGVHTPTPTVKITSTPTPSYTPTPTIRITNTPTPTLHITPTNTPTPVNTNTPTPTVCVTPGQVMHVKVSCSTNCSVQ